MSDSQLLERRKLQPGPTNEMTGENLALAKRFALARLAKPLKQFAEDIASEALLAAVDKFDPSKATFTTFLYYKVRFTVLEFLRREAKYCPAAQDELDKLNTETTTDEHSDQHDAMNHCLGELSESEKELVIQRFWESRSHAELAGILNIQVPTARRRSSRIISKLRQCVAACLKRGCC